jgi:Carboxypeptidase regulatory-like domain
VNLNGVGLGSRFSVLRVSHVSRSLPVLLVAVSLAAGACGSQPPGPTRPGGRAPARAAAPRGAAAAREPVGDIGSLTGRVVADATGAPIRRAEVTATADGSYARRTLTDADGRYSFRELPVTRYRLACAKAGFVTVDLGQRGPFTLGREIEIVDAQTVRVTDVRLVRGAAISGRVVDESGEPVARVLVEAVRWGYARGQRVLQTLPSATATTDDLGRYRLYGLPAGEIYLRASMTYRGTAAIEDEQGMLILYVPAYYPGTMDVAQAGRLALAPGQEVKARDLVLTPTPGFRVSGLVVGSSGSPRENGDITLLQFADGAYDRPARGADSARIGPGGTFEVAGVAPGRYLLQVQTADLVERSDGRGGAFRQTRGQESALVPIVVKGANLDSLRIVTTRGGSARGRIVFEHGVSPRFGPNSVSVSAPPVGFPAPRGAAGGGRGGVRTDWTFDLSGLLGPRVFRATEPVGWTLKAVRLNGRDITDSPIDFTGSEAIDGLEVVLGTTTTEITGQVTGSGGRAISDYAVVCFPEEPGKWGVLALPAQSGPISRVVKVGRPDQHGRFRISGLPPGRYLAVAVPAIEEGAWNVVDVLRQLRPLGTPVTLADGDRKTMDLKLAALGG